ncbi:MAG: multicopper oxidase domain-containing protein [Actinobacteria bacterium]|nr:multicopper oxidase domain-containing protein [Actinomycetota bacterium]
MSSSIHEGAPAQPERRLLSRRNLLIGTLLGVGTGLGISATSGLRAAPASGIRGLVPPGLDPARAAAPVRQVALAVTDGWVGMPQGLPAIAPYFPDTLAPEHLDTYVFGFRDVTGLDRTQVMAQMGKAQISAPIVECTVGEELWVTLSNLGLVTRPDLVDSHTMHWHGFRNAIPFYDGVPETSVSVPIGRDFTYVFRPKDAGTYMYHCHFEDVEHVTMGMTGIVFVRPAGAAKQAYDAPDTAFDREYALLLTEFDLSGHWNDAHIQVSDWTNYRPNVWLMNGRAYPDTLEPAGTRGGDGDLVSGSSPHLQYQPVSSRIVANPGDRVLIRLANLGFEEQTLTFPGVPMRTVGSDARYLGPSQQTVADTVVLGAGESRDLVITAPAVGTYPLYNTDPAKYRGVPGDQWAGGQRTELVVTGTAPAQTAPNQWEL